MKKYNLYNLLDCLQGWMIPLFGCLLVACFFASCEPKSENAVIQSDASYIVVLGTAQDAGFPHINNPVEYEQLDKGEINKELTVSLGVIDLNEKKKWIFEATPDMPRQLYDLERDHLKNNTIINGVFLTHAHIGHYTGLMYFGREAMGANQIPVYAMPRMKDYLEENGPWSQLVALNNIELNLIKADSMMQLSNAINVTPFIVPHRDEFSETVGYKIEGKNKSALFIPDINKWDLWERSIVKEVNKVDYAFLDATFFKEGEIPRPMSEVPHPFIVETMKLFENESEEVKKKVIFIHFNHSNPGILSNHRLQDSVINLGYNFAKTGDKYPL